MRLADVIPFRPRFPKPEPEPEIDLLTAVDVAIRDLREISRLFIIKPAIERTALEAQVQEGVIRRCVWGNTGALVGDPSPWTGTSAGMELPCVTLAYLQRNPPGERTCASPHHVFPQDNFIGMTVHSSYTLYGAYYDLGRHYAGQLRLSTAKQPCEGALCAEHPFTGTIPACPPKEKKT